MARSLARAGALREGLRERDAADVIHALASPEVYGLLVLDRELERRALRALDGIDTLADQLLA